MDPQPPPSPSLLPTTAGVSVNHTDSANSSPRSRHDTTWDDNSLPPVPGGDKLRLMCSYGGHIIPRPNDKSLCYVGGDTRIVVADRHCSFTDFHSRLSHTLLNGRHFTLKYQLPSEDLDSLISLATNEDLENMIDEYDRTATATSPLKPTRLRLFLFPSKPETAASMGSLLDDAKSETWFVDALNGSGLLPRGLSESTAIDKLLELDRGMGNSQSCADLSAENEPSLGKRKEASVRSSAQEVVVETSSSFGSSSSSPTIANLPPIKVRGEEYMNVGLDEQFSSHNMSIALNSANLNSPPLPFVNIPAAAIRSGGGGDRVVGDDEKSEKSDHGMAAPSGLRKPPLPLQLVHRKLVDIHNLPSPDSKHAGGYNLPSPDSVVSDRNIASGESLVKQAIYNDPTQNPTREHIIPSSPNDPTQIPPRENIVPSPNELTNAMNGHIENSTSQIQMQHVADPTSQWSQQQFIPAAHYIHNQHTPMAPVSSYYPMYFHHQPPQQQTDHNSYPVYIMSSTQPNYDASSRPLTPLPLPPVYPTKPDTATTNMGGGAAAPMMVQVPAHHEFQQHYIVNPNTSVAVGGGNYGYEQYAHNLTQDHAAYYGQQVVVPPPQYQTMTPAAAMMYTQASTQNSSNNNP